MSHIYNSCKELKHNKPNRNIDVATIDLYIKYIEENDYNIYDILECLVSSNLFEYITVKKSLDMYYEYDNNKTLLKKALKFIGISRTYGWFCQKSS